jgi:hypothetical protein
LVLNFLLAIALQRSSRHGEFRFFGCAPGGFDSAVEA